MPKTRMTFEEQETLYSLLGDLRSNARMHCHLYVEHAEKDNKDMMSFCRRIAEYSAKQANTLRKVLLQEGWACEAIDVDEQIKFFKARRAGKKG